MASGLIRERGLRWGINRLLLLLLYIFFVSVMCLRESYLMFFLVAPFLYRLSGVFFFFPYVVYVYVVAIVGAGVDERT